MSISNFQFKTETLIDRWAMNEWTNGRSNCWTGARSHSVDRWKDGGLVGCMDLEELNKLTQRRRNCRIGRLMDE